MSAKDFGSLLHLDMHVLEPVFEELSEKGLCYKNFWKIFEKLGANKNFLKKQYEIWSHVFDLESNFLFKVLRIGRESRVTPQDMESLSLNLRAFRDNFRLALGIYLDDFLDLWIEKLEERLSDRSKRPMPNIYKSDIGRRQLELSEDLRPKHHEALAGKFKERTGWHERSSIGLSDSLSVHPMMLAPGTGLIKDTKSKLKNSLSVRQLKSKLKRATLGFTAKVKQECLEKDFDVISVDRSDLGVSSFGNKRKDRGLERKSHPQDLQLELGLENEHLKGFLPNNIEVLEDILKETQGVNMRQVSSEPYPDERVLLSRGLSERRSHTENIKEDDHIIRFKGVGKMAPNTPRFTDNQNISTHIQNRTNPQNLSQNLRISRQPPITEKKVSSINFNIFNFNHTQESIRGVAPGVEPKLNLSGGRRPVKSPVMGLSTGFTGTLGVSGTGEGTKVQENHKSLIKSYFNKKFEFKKKKKKNKKNRKKKKKKKKNQKPNDDLLNLKEPGILLENSTLEKNITSKVSSSKILSKKKNNLKLHTTLNFDALNEDKILTGSENKSKSRLGSKRSATARNQRRNQTQLKKARTDRKMRNPSRKKPSFYQKVNPLHASTLHRLDLSRRAKDSKSFWKSMNFGKNKHAFAGNDSFRTMKQKLKRKFVIKHSLEHRQVDIYKGFKRAKTNKFTKNVEVLPRNMVSSNRENAYSGVS